MSIANYRPLKIVGVAVLALSAGCFPSHPQSTFDPVGPVAQSQMDLFTLIFWVALVVFIGVEGLLVYAVLRFRRRPGQGVPVQTHGNTRLEIAWSVAPALVLLVVMVPTIQTIFRNATPPVPPSGEEILEITVTGHQWWWEFEYPSLGVVTANELHLPVGQVVNFTLLSNDVIHSFWVPKIGGKRDAIPGRANTLWLQVDVPGEYYGQCAELCGISHANMRFRVFAQEQSDFDSWVEGQLQSASEPSSPAALAGSELFLQNVSNGGANCFVCHTISGTTAQGILGPDLTHIGSRGDIASGMLENTSASLDRWLTDPQEVKPGAKMVIRDLSSGERADLIAYLQGLQ